MRWSGKSRSLTPSINADRALKHAALMREVTVNKDSVLQRASKRKSVGLMHMPESQCVFESDDVCNEAFMDEVLCGSGSDDEPEEEWSHVINKSRKVSELVTEEMVTTLCKSTQRMLYIRGDKVWIRPKEVQKRINSGELSVWNVAEVRDDLDLCDELRLRTVCDSACVDGARDIVSAAPGALSPMTCKVIAQMIQGDRWRYKKMFKMLESQFLEAESWEERMSIQVWKLRLLMTYILVAAEPHLQKLRKLASYFDFEACTSRKKQPSRGNYIACFIEEKDLYGGAYGIRKNKSNVWTR